MGEPSLAAALYLHIPFCRAKCHYCDFFSLAADPAWFAPYVQAVEAQMAWVVSQVEITPQTLYLGGGTPTVLPLDLLLRLLRACTAQWGPPATGEVTVEANPGTLSRGDLQRLAEAGVTRLSLGVQSTHERELRLLGRIHSAAEALQALEEAKEAGFRSVGVDLIFGLPGQTLRAWEQTLRTVLAFAPDHLSAYALTLEPGTSLHEEVLAGRLPPPDEDLAADMYLLAEEVLDVAGYQHYELSNWAHRDPTWDHRSRHNLAYWRNETWLGFGAGAHSHAFGRRWHEVEDLPRFLRAWAEGGPPEHGAGRVPPYASPTACEVEVVSREQAMAETLFLGLRLVEEGVPRWRFRERFGVPVEAVYGPVLEDLEAQGLLQVDEEKIILTPRGRLLANQVFLRFLP
ncbi:MAG: radical SAM family heme chaperone HemW [Anaerolineae bacterium]